MMAGETRYCICCGEQVPANKISREGRVELTCVYCGFLLDTVVQEEKPIPDQEAVPAQEAAEVKEAPAVREPAPVKEEQKPRPPPSPAPAASPRDDVKPARPLQPTRMSASECIITSDDAELTRDLLKGMLLEKKLTQTVISTENGQEFVKAFTKRLAEKQPVNLVILDLEMPVMDGITAARVMRAVEGKYTTTRVPILFFSAWKCDETLRKQLSMFSPASYVNKGSDSDPAKLMERIDQLINHLLSKHPASSA